jgi:hypothetical protein
MCHLIISIVIFLDVYCGLRLRYQIHAGDSGGEETHGSTRDLSRRHCSSEERVVSVQGVCHPTGKYLDLMFMVFYYRYVFLSFCVLAWCLGSSEENNEDGQGPAQRGEGGPHGRLQGNRALHRLPKCSLCTGERLSRVHFSRLKSWHVCTSLTCARLCAD